MNTTRALCIGINDYPGTDSDLTGCLNDAKDWRAVIQPFASEVMSLHDKAADKKSMLAALKELLWNKSKRGDLAFITYSGHGTWIPDKNGDEPDGREECLCPWDIGTTGAIITDDELYDIFAKTPKGVDIVMIADSCHSGTVTRFCPPILGSLRRTRYLALDHFMDDRQLKKALKHEGGPVRKGYVRRNLCVLLAGCKDTEYSYDAVFGKRPNGAFTRVALDVLKTENPHSYLEWYQGIRQRLPSQNYPQTPQLQGTPTMKKWRIFE